MIKDKVDTRKKIITISKKGEAMLPQLMPLWKDFEMGVGEIFEKAEINILEVLEKIETQIEEKSIYDRVIERAKARLRANVKIEKFSAVYKADFKNLNLEWLNHYFEVEPIDKKILNNPESEIINTGGMIFFALIDEKVVGTCAMIKINDSFELSKGKSKKEIPVDSRWTFGEAKPRFFIRELSSKVPFKTQAQQMQPPPPKLEAKMKAEAITNLSKALIESYIFLDTAQKVEAILNANLKNGLYDKIDDPMEFAQTITKDIQAITQDKHLRFGFNPQLAADLLKGGDDDETNPILKKKFEDEMKQNNYGFKKLEVLN
ncbi:unnamed protein product, partial [Rotaria sp. Silwood1]